MSRGRRARRRAILIVAAAAASLASPARPGNFVDFGPTTITITIPIDMVGGSQELANRWGPAITRFWNPGGEGRRWCGKEVVITTTIRVIPSLDQHIEGRHVVFVVGPRRPGQYLWEDAGSAAASPTREIGTGYWPEQGRMSDQDYDALIGSSAGAFLGAEILFEGISPMPEIAAAHDLDEVVDCRVRARHEVEWTTDGVVVGGVRQDVRLGVAFSIELEEEEGGRLRGRAEGSARLQGTSSETRFTCVAEIVGAAEYSFEVTGSRVGDRVEVRLPSGLEMTSTITPTDCPPSHDPRPYRTSFTIPYLETLEGVLERGVFQRTTRATQAIGAIPGTLVYTVEIEDREAGTP